MFTDSETGLWVFLPIMIALALVGVVLAGHYEAGALHYTGFALSIVSVIWIFGGLKHYYDVKDYGPRSNHS